MLGTEWEIERDTNPWRSIVDVSNSEIIEAGDISLCQGFDHLKKFDQPDLLLGEDRSKRIVINNKYFSSLRRIDATRISLSDDLLVGDYRDLTFQRLSLRQLAAFLIESQIVLTYAHIGASLKVTEENESDKDYTIRVQGEHVYYTSKKHTSPVDFRLSIGKKTGKIIVKNSR